MNHNQHAQSDISGDDSLLDSEISKVAFACYNIGNFCKIALTRRCIMFQHNVVLCNVALARRCIVCYSATAQSCVLACVVQSCVGATARCVLERPTARLFERNVALMQMALFGYHINSFTCNTGYIASALERYQLRQSIFMKYVCSSSWSGILEKLLQLDCTMTILFYQKK